MNLNEIKLGTRLELELIDISGEKVGSTYVSQLLEHQDDTLLYISAPIYEARLVYIPDGTLIHLTFIHGRQGLFEFTARVKSKEFRDNVAVLLIEPNSEIEKIQRRMNYRLEIVLDVLMWLPTADMKNPVKAYTKNISGSGLCIISEIDIPKHTEIKIDLELSTEMNISAKCLILRSTAGELRKVKSYELGMYFTEISMKSKEALIKFIYHEQRMLIKKDKTKN